MCALMSAMPQLLHQNVGAVSPPPRHKCVVWPSCSAAYGPMSSNLDLTKRTTREIPNGVNGKTDGR